MEVQQGDSLSVPDWGRGIWVQPRLSALQLTDTVQLSCLVLYFVHEYLSTLGVVPQVPSNLFLETGSLIGLGIVN